MSTGNDPLDDWGPQAPVHRGRADGAHPSAGSAAATGSATGQRRTRTYMVGAMVVGDLALIALALVVFEPPVRWVVLAVGVLGLAAAAYMWHVVGRQIRRREEQETGGTYVNPHYPDA